VDGSGRGLSKAGAVRGSHTLETKEKTELVCAQEVEQPLYVVY
jgi:hypothetical protein